MSTRGQWDIKLYKMKNKVAMYINEYAGNRPGAKLIISKLKAERTPIYMVSEKFNDDIKKIVAICKEIKIFYEIENKKTGVYIGKKCSNAKEASAKIESLGSEDTSIYFIKGSNCNEVTKEILDISKTNELEIEEQDIEEGKVSK